MRHIALFAAASIFATGVSSNALADSCSCGLFSALSATSTTGPAVSGTVSSTNAIGVSGTATNLGGYGVEGIGEGAGVVGHAGSDGQGGGVYGTSTSGEGVDGVSISGIGVNGSSETGNGVVASNLRTDWNAAALSALPGNSNGLGIYSGGGAEKPGGGSWSNTSDARVKKDVKDYHVGLAALKRLHPVRYKYNGLGGTQDDGHEFVGVIAQELEKVVPEMVTPRKGKLHPGDAEETLIKHVDPSDFTYVLINAVQEQQKIIEEQDARIARLERGRPTLVSSLVPGGVGVAALGLLPLGLVAGRNRRKSRES